MVGKKFKKSKIKNKPICKISEGDLGNIIGKRKNWSAPENGGNPDYCRWKKFHQHIPSNKTEQIRLKYHVVCALEANGCPRSFILNAS